MESPDSGCFLPLVFVATKAERHFCRPDQTVGYAFAQCPLSAVGYLCLPMVLTRHDCHADTFQ